MRIGVLTSGGDAPGMNACVRAVVRGSLTLGWEVFGSRYGYNGLVGDEIAPMGHDSVSNIIQRGGTILGAGRCDEFTAEAGLRKAADLLRRYEIDGLVGIGGDGTFRGLRDLTDHWDGSVIGIPGTVDNDATGSDYTIGFDTAVNTGLEAIDRIRDTAEAYERCFIVEVMGRGSGAIAMSVALAGGAEDVCVPETPTDFDAMAERLTAGRDAGRLSSIIVAAEGDEAGGAHVMAEELGKRTGIKFRVCVLGHVQRGGCPSARDRILASRLGAYAVDLLAAGERACIIGEVDGDMHCTQLSNVGEAIPCSTADFDLVRRLSR